MTSFKLSLAAAAALSLGMMAPATAEVVVHQRTIVTHSVQTHPANAHHVRENHTVCKNVWRNHHRHHVCRTVRWTH